MDPRSAQFLDRTGSGVVEDDNQATEATFDGASRVIQTIDAIGNRTSTTYDFNSNPLVARTTEKSSLSAVADETFTTR